MTLPRHLRANSEVQVCFQFSDYTGVDLKASLKFYPQEWHKEEREEIAEIRDTFHDGESKSGHDDWF